MIVDLEPYPSYTNSGVEWLGAVPDGWQVRRLGSIARPVSRRGRADLPLLSVLREKGVIRREDGDGNHNVVPEDLTNYKVVDPGDLVINKMKAWQGSLGVADTRGIVSPAYFVYRLRVIDRRYAHTLLRSRPYVDAFAAVSSGVRIDQWDLSPIGLKSTPVLIPPAEDQASIVVFLDRIDARIQQFIAAKERLIALLEEEKNAVIYRAVTAGLDPQVSLKPSGVDWLGDVPHHWDMGPLGHSVASSVTGTWGEEPDGDNDVICVRVADFDRVRRRVQPCPDTLRSVPVADRRRRRLEVGDLLIEKSGGGDNLPVGTVVLFDRKIDAVSSNFVTRLRPAAGYRPEYLLYLHWALYARRVNVRSIKQTTGIQNLDLRSYLSERVAFPPPAEQEAIAGYLEGAVGEIDRVVETARVQIRLLREYRTRLTADAVTGKLDVRGAAEHLRDPAGSAIDVRLAEESAG
ncbi:MAG TPA: restriction endonuclease subunit S [Solirubrobacterales bacterium]